MEKKKKSQDQKDSKYPGLERYARYSGLAFQMIAIILVAAWGGLKMDDAWNEGDALFVIIMSLLGVAIGIYVALKDFIHPGKE